MTFRSTRTDQCLTCSSCTTRHCDVFSTSIFQLKKWFIKERPLSPWFDSDCRAARRRARLCERRYRRTNTAPHCQAWVRALEKKKDLVRAKQEAYWNTRIKSNADRPKKLWRCLDSLLLRDQNKSALQQTKMSADKLHSFFDEKVQSVRR